MHADYFFLMESLENTESDVDILAHAEAVFDSWLDENGDENNGSRIEALILKDGRVLCPPGLDDYATELLKTPQAERFDRARKSALECVCVDFGFFGLQKYALGEPTADESKAQKAIEELAFGDLLKQAHRVGAKWLSDEYAKLVKTDRKKEWDLNEYRRRQTALAYELLRDAHTPPFATDGNPYEYRAFDLTYGSDDGNSVLIADIHT